MNAMIFDNLASTEQLAAVRAAWPGDDWPGWVSYGPAPDKRASNASEPVPPACALLLAKMATLPVAELARVPEALPDLSLWGSGLHEMPPGPGLGRHLDAEVHGRLGLTRMLSAVLWVHDRWEPDWGGELVIESGLTLQPVPGRMAVFDCRNEWHEVRSVRGPAVRRSLAMFWYAVGVSDGRRRAWFEPR